MLHGWIVLEPRAHFAKDTGGVLVGRLDDAVVHPLTLTTRGNQTRAAQVGKVAGYFWLAAAKHLHKETDTNLVVSNKVYYAQASLISQRSKKRLDVVVLCHSVVLSWLSCNTISTIPEFLFARDIQDQNRRFFYPVLAFKIEVSCADKFASAFHSPYFHRESSTSYTG
jgi:hypothetical protein